MLGRRNNLSLGGGDRPGLEHTDFPPNNIVVIKAVVWENQASIRGFGGVCVQQLRLIMHYRNQDN